MFIRQKSFFFFLKRRVSLNSLKSSAKHDNITNTKDMFTCLRKQQMQKVAPKVYTSKSVIDISTYPHGYFALVWNVVAKTFQPITAEKGRGVARITLML